MHNNITQQVLNIFQCLIELAANFISLITKSSYDNKQHTNEVFTEKWTVFNKNKEEVLELVDKNNLEVTYFHD